MIFNINFSRLCINLLPTFLRQPIIYGILHAGAQVLKKSTYAAFTTARTNHNYQLNHNGQVCYLRAVLNDTFGGGFDILDVEDKGEWLYAITEKGTGILLTYGEDGNAAEVSNGQKVPVVYNEALLNVAQNSFIVRVPYKIYQTNLPAVAALVDKYKLISKRAIYVANS
ncbi:MAG: hypothetical protein NC301_07740 [Bacteroides sp.]|nr:hypothetical protein [Bacteroides sp.]MCM1380026.1 hypothetical protein [Bacteroides sp.]MCM1446379.1 hypothetical protein [Prevotella sp.]